MGFSNIWSKVIPAGGTAAKLIDDHIRQLRLDIEERMSTLFEPSVVGDPDHPQPISFARDPLVLANAIIGKKLAKQLVIPYTAFQKGTLGKEFYFDAYKLTAFTDSTPLYCPIILPPGVTLTQVELFNQKDNAGTVIMNVRKRQMIAGAPMNDSTIIATVTNLAVGVVITPLGAAITEVILPDWIYYIEVDATGTAGNGFEIFGARLTYDCPNAQDTI